MQMKSTACSPLLTHIAGFSGYDESVLAPPGAAAGGEGEVVSVCVSIRQQLLEVIDALPLPPNFLDKIIDELGGPGQVR